jgi:hypothetical protein
MTKPLNIDPAAQTHARIARATIAAVFVAGLTALIVVPQGGESPSLPGSIGETSAVFLHAPAADPSLPSAEAAFASRPAVDEPSSPTF